MYRLCPEMGLEWRNEQCTWRGSFWEGATRGSDDGGAVGVCFMEGKAEAFVPTGIEESLSVLH